MYCLEHTIVEVMSPSLKPSFTASHVITKCTSNDVGIEGKRVNADAKNPKAPNPHLSHQALPLSDCMVAKVSTKAAVWLN